jgi:hypothetical protein
MVGAGCPAATSSALPGGVPRMIPSDRLTANRHGGYSFPNIGSRFESNEQSAEVDDFTK